MRIILYLIIVGMLLVTCTNKALNIETDNILRITIVNIEQDSLVKEVTNREDITRLLMTMQEHEVEPVKFLPLYKIRLHKNDTLHIVFADKDWRFIKVSGRTAKLNSPLIVN